MRRQHAAAERRVKALEPALRSALARWEATAADALAPALIEGLTAHYEFNKRLSESAGRSANATFHGSPHYEVGLLGSALVLDGRRPVELTAGPDLDAPWAFSLWL
ncbi:MAG: hypothetical protein ACYC6M_15175, partial [Terriglobales bacterium]